MVSNWRCDDTLRVGYQVGLTWHNRFGQQKCPVFFSDFAGNFCAQKSNKAQTKQANITGVHYFPVIWSWLRAHQQGWCQLFLIFSLLYFPKKLYQLPLLSPLHFGALRLCCVLTPLRFDPCCLLHGGFPICFNRAAYASMQSSSVADRLSTSILNASSSLDRISALILSASSLSNRSVSALLLAIAQYIASPVALLCYLTRMSTFCASILSLYLANNLSILYLPLPDCDTGRRIQILFVVCSTSPRPLRIFPPVVAMFLITLHPSYPSHSTPPLTLYTLVPLIRPILLLLRRAATEALGFRISFSQAFVFRLLGGGGSIFGKHEYCSV